MCMCVCVFFFFFFFFFFFQEGSGACQHPDMYPLRVSIYRGLARSHRSACAAIFKLQ